MARTLNVFRRINYPQTFLLLIILFDISVARAQMPARSDAYPIQPVLFTSVHLKDNFWAPRIRTNHEVTIPFTLGKCKETGRIKNFEIAAGLKSGTFCTDFVFDDTDVYKIIEGASYAMQISKDAKLDATVDSLINLIGLAQEDDGYLYTNRTIMGANAHEWAGPTRWLKDADLSHELYNVGHLIEAAIAHHHATGKRNFLDIAIKAADRVCADFGPDKLHIYPGHQIVELAMAKLYVETGNRKYLDAGKFFLDVRGPAGTEYNQAHVKVTDQHEAVGHAVRATYMYAGMADIAALTQDQSYINAIDDIWEDVVSKKLYLTGGIGATGNGEAFGKPYELPNLSAYNETCASIANIYWNYRLFLLHGDSKYFDVLERTLYNAFLSGVALTGDKFFYPNPLESHGQHTRSPWFSCACCPSNVARFVPSIGGYFYAQKDKSIFVNLFATNTSEFKIGDRRVSLDQKTNYPWDGDVLINITPDKAFDFEIKVRIPGWAVDIPLPSDLYSFADDSKQQPRILINDKPQPLEMTNGYVSLKRKWKAGDRITLQLPMEIRKLVAHASVEADEDRIAVSRGPLVYCTEWPDNKASRVLNLTIDREAKLSGTFKPDLLNGIYQIEGTGKSVERTKTSTSTSDAKVVLIPYYAWAHRGAGEMQVWIAEKETVARPLPLPTLASQSKISASHETRALRALNDQMEPKNSNDQSIVHYHWWPMKDTVQWVQYDFSKTETISSSKVYWFDDGESGECRVPVSWKLFFKKGNDWVEVSNPKGYELLKDQYSNVKFDPVTTTSVRMEVKFPPKFSSGILEWSVE